MKNSRLQASIACVVIILTCLVTQAAAKPKKKKKVVKPCATSLAQCDTKFDMKGCDGSDGDLNQRKNKTTVPASFRDVSYPDMIQMKEPASWSAAEDDRSTLETNLIDGTVLKEGAAIRVYGYLRYARKEGPESCNCRLGKGSDEKARLLQDIHLAITNKKGTSEKRSFTAEITPRVRAGANNPKELIWNSVRNYEGLFVRVSGYLMLDTEHLHESTPARKKSWEVHPVIKFEVCAVDAQNCSKTGTAGWRTVN